jgi:hypothetical protein
MSMTTPETVLGQVSALTLITPIKQGYIPEMPTIRYVDRLRAVLGSVQEMINNRQPTVLDGINTVHFARWVIIDNDQRLLFTSNFDGTLNSYLRDFTNVDYVAAGLNLIWSNCEEYPGADPQHFQRFEAWVRKYSSPTACFYSATPGTTVRDVKWLRLFKSRYDEFVQSVQADPANLSPAFTRMQQDVLHAAQEMMDRQTVLNDMMRVQRLFTSAQSSNGQPLEVARKFLDLLEVFLVDSTRLTPQVHRAAYAQLATLLQCVLDNKRTKVPEVMAALLRLIISLLCSGKSGEALLAAYRDLTSKLTSLLSSPASAPGTAPDLAQVLEGLKRAAEGLVATTPAESSFVTGTVHDFELSEAALLARTLARR